MELNAAKYWSEVALDTLKIDFRFMHSPEQPGPTRSSRALALVHTAFHDAYVSSVGIGKRYRYNTKPQIHPSKHLAQLSGSKAAFHALQMLYQQQDMYLLAKYEAFKSQLVTLHGPLLDNNTVNEAERIGRKVANDLLSARQMDTHRSAHVTPLLPPRAYGSHAVDPISRNFDEARMISILEGEYWGLTEPYGISPNDVLESRAGPPPVINSTYYRNELAEVKEKGHVSRRNFNIRETQIGFFWAYDGAVDIGTPPRLYNQVVHRIAEEDGLTEYQWSELLCRCNLALADASIVAWSAKYFYYFWRPVVGIRQDLNNPDQGWMPIGAPATNNPMKIDFTPAFPAYPSGHATFGAACFETVKLFRKNELNKSADEIDRINLMLKSDELINTANDYHAQTKRPEILMRYTSIDKLINDNLESRVWLGVHWRFDGDAGVRSGKEVATRAYGKALMSIS